MYLKELKDPCWPVLLIVISLHYTLHKAAAGLGGYPIYVCACIVPLLFFLSLCGCGMSMLNNEPKHL